ncbi:MAG TPA: GNAT family N-acetyltransferase [Flavobacteriales bacterium]|nr:GNAT family N-acetyltransferase [Flavobacteriales bacterium]
MKFTFQIVKDEAGMNDAYGLIKQLSPNVTHEAYTQYIADMVKSGYFQVIARNEEKKAVAVSGIWIATKIYSGKYMEMDNVVVDQACRNAGLGKQLYDYCLNLAKENGCAVIMLDAYLENERAHKFYLDKGFIKRGYHFLKWLDK